MHTKLREKARFQMNYFSIWLVLVADVMIAMVGLAVGHYITLIKYHNSNPTG